MGGMGDVGGLYSTCEAGEVAPDDPVEERESRNCRPVGGKDGGNFESHHRSTKLQRIATLAREDPERVLTTLAHHIDVPFLKEAYRRTRKDGAVGVDGQTAQVYGEDLDSHLGSLLHRFKSGTYYAPPVRRVYVPKDNGKASRPIGIPSFEDKVLQRAVAMVLEAVYEQDFRDCSYGFRPKTLPSPSS